MVFRGGGSRVAAPVKQVQKPTPPSTAEEVTVGGCPEIRMVGFQSEIRTLRSAFFKSGVLSTIGPDARVASPKNFNAA